MSYQTKVEICIRGIGYGLAVLCGLWAGVAASHIHNDVLRWASATAAVILALVAISRLMNWLRELAAL